MRIVHINVTAAFSTGRIAVELCRQAMREGHRALLCYARGSCPSDVPGYRIGSTAQTVGYTLLSRLTDRQGFFGRRETEKLVAQLKKFRPDIVHLHNLHGSYLHLPTLFSYLKENDLPTVWTLHDCWAFTGHCAYFSLGEDAAPADGGGRRRRSEACGEGCLRWQSGCGHCSLLREYPRSWFRDQSAWNWREKRTLFSGLPHLVLTTPSEWLKAQVESSFLGQYPVYALPNGIDTDAFAPCADEAFLRNAAHYYGLDEAEGRHLVLSVASTWEPRKGLEDLLELAEKLGPEYCVAAVGLDEYQIRSLPEKSVLGIPRTGNLNDLCALYTAADLCVSLSHAETMGMTLVEALACGTQVLCWDVTAMPEIVTDEVGRTVPMGDYNGLAQAVRELCDQPKSPRDCRNRALEYAAPRRYRAYMRLYDGMYRNGPGYLQAVEEACRVRTEEDD